MPLKIAKAPAKGKATLAKELKDHGKTVAEESAQEEVEKPATPAAKKNKAPVKDTAPAAEEPGIDASAPWCAIGYEASYTHNLGNYQSARVQVTLTVPCPHEEINDTFDFAKEWVDERLQAMVEELSGDEE